MGPKEKLQPTPVSLTIATSDSGGGAGIQADLRTFSALNTFGVSAFAALTAQNPDGVSAIHALPIDFLRSQLQQLHSWFAIKAAKTGMLFNRELILETAHFLKKSRIPTVVDPVMVATSGARLLELDAVETLKRELLPVATLITPNLDEAHVLLGYRPDSVPAMREAARALCDQYGCACLLKGGHLQSEILVDILFLPSGDFHEFSTQRSPDVNTHGSGCTLSAAITAGLAKNLPLFDAVAQAHDFLTGAIKVPLYLEHQNKTIPFIKSTSINPLS